MRILTTVLLLAATLAFTSLAGEAQTANTTDLLQPLHFLIGKWSGGGKSDSGPIEGISTFREDLQGHVLIRRDSSTFAKTSVSTKPYEQMMVIAPDNSGKGTFAADYWDSVGHVIVYTGTVTLTNGLTQVQFVSAPSSSTPTFRLTYTETTPTKLHTVFELQAPGSTEWHTVADGYSTKVGD